MGKLLGATVAAVLALVAGCAAPVGDRVAATAGLEVTGVWTGVEEQRFEAVLEAFTASTGIPVTYTSLGDDASAVLRARVDAGAPPDVAVLSQPALLEDFARQGMLHPLDDDVRRAVEQHYDPVWRRLGTVDGSLYGVWFKAANKSTVWYRPAAFRAAGVEPPADWDSLVATSDALARAGVRPLTLAAGDAWTLTDWFENVYLRLAGPQRYDQLTRHEISWTDESVKEALRVLDELWGRPGVLDGGRTNALSTTFPASVSRVFSAEPTAAMVYEGDFVAGVVRAETEAVVGRDADFFDFPALGGSAPAVVGGGDVAVQLRDRDEADALMRYLASPEAAAVWASRGGFTSPNRSLDLAVYPDDVSRRSAEALREAGDNFRFDMSDLGPTEFSGTPGQGQWRILQDFVLSGDVDATAAALEEAAERAYGSPPPQAGGAPRSSGSP